MEPIEKLRAGDADAIDWLVDTYSDRLLKTATVILGDRYAAEDVVQESLVDAVRSLPNFRGDASVYTWLYAILIRRCRRRQRQLARQRLQYLPRMVLDRLRLQQGEYVQVLNFDERLTLRSAIRNLPFKYREVIVLFYYEELSIKELSHLLKLPEGTVKNRLHRARALLRTLLREEGKCGREEAIR